jgi:hypothetical protein
VSGLCCGAEICCIERALGSAYCWSEAFRGVIVFLLQQRFHLACAIQIVIIHDEEDTQ